MDAASLILLQTPRAPAAAEAPRRDSAAFDRALDNAVAGASDSADAAGGAQNRKTAESPDAPAAENAPQTSEQPAHQQPAQQPAQDGTSGASSSASAQNPAVAVPAASAAPVPVAGMDDLAAASSGAAPQTPTAQGAAGATPAPAAANPLNGVAQSAESADAAPAAAPAQSAQTTPAAQTVQSQQIAQGSQLAQAAPSQPVAETAPATPQQGQAQTQPQAQPQQQVSAQSQAGVQPQTTPSADGAEPMPAPQNASAPADPRGNDVAPTATSASAASAVTDGRAAPAAAPAVETSLRAAAAEAEQGRQMRAGKGATSVTGAATQQTGAAQPQSQSQMQSANAAQPSQAAASDIRIVADQAGADADGGLDSKPASVDAVALRSEHGHRTETSGVNAAHAADRATPRMDAAAIVRLAQQIGARAGEGANRFEIRMDPPELGRIDVRLRIDSDNRAHAVLLAERSDTLSDLSKAARALERALEDAGLKLAQNGLEFGLKRDAPQQDQSRGGSPYALADLGDADAPAPAPAAAPAMAGEADVTAYYGFKVARAARLAVSI